MNAVGTELEHPHDVVEAGPHGEFTVRYTSGPKRDLRIHFFSEAELSDLFGVGFVPVVPLSRKVVARDRPGAGHWHQWEGIRRRTL